MISHWKIEKKFILRLTSGIFTSVTMIWIRSEHVQLEILVYPLPVGHGDSYSIDCLVKPQSITGKGEAVELKNRNRGVVLMLEDMRAVDPYRD